MVARPLVGRVLPRLALPTSGSRCARPIRRARDGFTIIRCGSGKKTGRPRADSLAPAGGPCPIARNAHEAGSSPDCSGSLNRSQGRRFSCGQLCDCLTSSTPHRDIPPHLDECASAPGETNAHVVAFLSWRHRETRPRELFPAPGEERAEGIGPAEKRQSDRRASMPQR
jgi:hypothetical protein